jgi:hypothetical protein
MVVLGIAQPSVGQWLKYPSPNTPRLPNGAPNLAAPTPRTPDGHPDLSGIWNVAGTDYYQDLAKGLKPGEVQLTPWAAAVQKQRIDREHFDDPYSLCLPLGVPRINLRSELKIVPSSPALTIFLYEIYGGMTYRQVFTDGRPLPTPADNFLPTWLGYSVGRWDGDTFVVQTTGFRDGGWLSTGAAYPNSDALLVTERFTRKDFGHLDLTVTIDDRKAFVKPWTNTIPMRLRPDTELLEAVCDNQRELVQHYRTDAPPPEPPSPRD